MILLDTHVLLSSRLGTENIGPRSRELVEWAWRDATLAVSAISFWEIDMLHRKGRVRLLQDIAAWRTQLLGDGLIEIPVDGTIAIRANRLLNFHSEHAHEPPPSCPATAMVKAAVSLAAFAATLLACGSPPGDAGTKLHFAVASFQHKTCTFCLGGDSEIRGWLRYSGLLLVDALLSSGSYIGGFV